ncbi:hypothetical protein AVEN_126958-1 [Araneus ventricosus]|uniref:Uncharacterized protein n=1 Tax=Araneus ventricosus TaxID=182803 RepID=A0A4Y2EEG9_ARAVE|nr:hypothetical protein AVEN_126958-1 [Araneus ventricosus]
MLSVSHYTYLHSGLDFLQHIVQHGRCYGGISISNASSKILQCRRKGRIYLPFMCPYKKKSNGVKSGERGSLYETTIPDDLILECLH